MIEIINDFIFNHELVEKSYAYVVDPLRPNQYMTFHASGGGNLKQGSNRVFEQPANEATQGEAVLTALQRDKAEGVIQLVAAYVGHNHVALSDIPTLIAAFKTGVDAAYAPPVVISAEAFEPDQAVARGKTPAVPVDESVFDTHIICLDDGKSFKSLKRHIGKLGYASVDEYRRHWNLAADYPMVAKNYSEARSSLAKDLGLGRKGSAARSGKAAKAPAPKADSEFSLDNPKYPKGDMKPEDTFTADGLICLIDGEVTKNMGRHLKGLGVTTEQYLEAFGLPETYPMTSGEFSKASAK